MPKRKKKNSKKIRYILIFIILILFLIIFFKNRRNLDNIINENIVDNVNNLNTVESQNRSNLDEDINNNNTDKTKEINFNDLQDSEKLASKGLPVLMYHFFYDKSIGESAKDGNWLEVRDFENHIKYLTENDYYFPTWQQVEDYIDGKTALPKKSIVLTVDDGEESFFKVALPVIEKYDISITEFLVTSWNGWFKNDYPAKQVSYQSHSDSMHKAGSNGKGVMLSWSYDKILDDCKQSRSVLGDEAIAFCYPFGQYNETSKKAVKDAGFKLAFTTEGGRVKVGADKFALPRVRTSTKTNLENFKKLIE